MTNAFPLSSPAVSTLPTVRELPPEEWARLLPFEPFASGGLPPSETSRIIVAEIDGPAGPVIVGYWGAFWALRIEPLWIDPAYRRRPGMVRRLWRGMTDLLRSLDARVAFACIFDADAPNIDQARRLGFTKVAGDLYFIEIPREDS